MGKKAGRKKGNSGAGSGEGGFSVVDVDPRCIRYAHSKVKPMFSGCGRTIEQTLGEIRDGRTRASDLPMITVLLGPLDPACNGQQCFFSLNNRRLFVFKACREEGLLGPSGLVRVRARAMKVHERERYTLDRCSLQAKFLFDTAKSSMVVAEPVETPSSKTVMPIPPTLPQVAPVAASGVANSAPKTSEDGPARGCQQRHGEDGEEEEEDTAISRRTAGKHGGSRGFDVFQSEDDEDEEE